MSEHIGYDYNTRFINQQMKLFRAGLIIYVCGQYMTRQIETQMKLEDLRFEKKTICDGKYVTSQYSYKLKYSWEE